MTKYEWEDFRNAQLERFNIDFTTYYTISKFLKNILYILPFIALIGAMGAGMYYEATYGLGADPLACQPQHVDSNIFRQLHIFLYH